MKKPNQNHTAITKLDAGRNCDKFMSKRSSAVLSNDAIYYGNVQAGHMNMAAASTVTREWSDIILFLPTCTMADFIEVISKQNHFFL